MTVHIPAKTFTKSILRKERMRAKLSLLSDVDLSEVHEASMRALSEIGIRVTSEKVLGLLRKAGAEVNRDVGIAKFPKGMVEGAIKSAQKPITLFSRDQKHDCPLNDRSIPALTTDGTAFQILDFGATAFRRSTSKDLFKLAVVSDYLRDIDLFWPMVVAGDVPDSEHNLKEFAISLLGTGKHIQHEASGELDAQTEISLASAIVGGEENLRKRPIFSAVQCPVSPFLLEKESAEAAVEFSRAGIPIVGMSIALSGVTAPASIAGVITASNIEVLSSLILSQAASEGAPFIYSVSSAPMNIEDGAFLSGSPELAMISAAAAQMGAHYGLPTLVAGMVTDAHYQSQQVGFEKLQTGLMPTMAGASIISGIGGIDKDDTASLEQLVIDCEIWNSILRIARGFEVDDDSISFELMSRLGSNPDYQADVETMKRFRKEYWQPRLPIRQKLDVWSTGGSKKIEDLAHETVVEVLSNHKPEPIDRGVEKQIMEIYKKFQKRVRH